MMAPSIGRKVWFWANAAAEGVLDSRQAFDATVIFVHPADAAAAGATFVRLMVVDHEGCASIIHNVELRDPAGDQHGGADSYATWMPYQVSQADKTTAAAPVQVSKSELLMLRGQALDAALRTFGDHGSPDVVLGAATRYHAFVMGEAPTAS